METLFVMTLGNLAVAGALAVLLLVLARVCRRPALMHALWLLVLIKFITPPVWAIPVPLNGTGGENEVNRRPAADGAEAGVADSPGTSAALLTAGRAETPLPESAPLPVQLAGRSQISNPDAAQFVAGSVTPVDPASGMAVGSVPQEAIMPRTWPTPPAAEPVAADTATADDSETSPASADRASAAVSVAANVEHHQAAAFSSVDGVLKVVLVVWIVGSVVFLILSLIRILLFQNLLRNAQPASAALQGQTDELAAQLGLSRGPKVSLLPGAVSPMLWAGGRVPRLLFPRELVGRTDEASRATLLLHELAHLRRGDHWVRFLELVTLSLYWWNPIVWLARREIHRYEEECCDALVVRHTSDGGRLYAGALLDTIDFLAEARPPLPPIASGIGQVGFLRHRLKQIFAGTTQGRMSRTGRLAVFALAFVVLPMLPVLGGPEENSPDATGAPSAAAAKKPAASTSTGKQKPSRTVLALPPTIHGVEPTRFQTNSTPLQFEPLEVRSTSVSPDGRLLATGHGRWTTEGVVRIWDLKAMQEVAAFREEKGIASVVFSPDGKYLASAGWSQKVIIRDSKTFKPLHQFAIDSVARLAFSPDSKTLAGATESQNLWLWDVASGKPRPELKGTYFRMQHVAYSRDGRYLAVGGGKFENPTNGRVAVWDLKSGKQLKIIDNFTRPVIGVAISPDGKTLAAAGFNMELRAWNLPTLKPRFSSRGHTAYIESVGFTPDGSSIVTTAYDGTTRFWNARTGAAAASVRGHRGGVLTAAFAEKGKKLITGGIDKTIRFWDLSTYRQTAELVPGALTSEVREPVVSVAYSPTGKHIATGHADKTVRLRDANTGEILKILDGHDDVAPALAFSPDGRMLATGSYDHAIKLWNIPDGTERQTLPGHTNWVFSVAFSRDGKTLVSGSYDKTIRLWNVADGRPIGEPLTGHTATVRSVAFAPNGKRVVSGSGDRTVRIWDVARRKSLLTLKGHQRAVRAVAFSPDGQQIASAGEDRSVRLWNAADGSMVRQLAHANMVWCLAYSPQGRSLATGGFDNRIIIWDPATGKRRVALRGHSEVVTSLAFAPDMRGLVSGSYDKTVRLWKSRPAPISDLLTIAVSSEAVRSVGFSPDGTLLATAGHDGLARVWNLKTGTLVRVLRGHSGGVRSLAFSPDGRRLATGGWDHSIVVWDVTSGKRVVRFDSAAEKHDVIVLAFTPDGRKIVSGGGDRTVRVWGIASKRQLWKSPAQGLAIAGVDVSPDGQSIVSVTGDFKRKTEAGQITFWNTETGKPRFQLPGPVDGKMVEFSPDGKRVVIGSGNSKVPLQLLDVASRRLTTGPAGYRGRFLPGGKTMAVARGPNRQVLLYDLVTNRELAAYVGHPAQKSYIFQLAISPDGSVIASASGDGSVKLWPTRVARRFEPKQSIQAVTKDAARFAYPINGGRQLVTGGHDQQVRIWDRKTGKLVKTLSGHKGGINWGTLSPDGKRLATASWDTTVRIWDLAAMKPTGIVLKHDKEVVHALFTRDGRRLLTGGRGKRLRLWDVNTGKQIRASKAQEKPIVCFDLSPDGKTVAVAVSDWKKPRESAVVRLFSFADFREISTPLRHRFEVKTVRYSTTGRHLAIGGSDFLTLLDAKTGRTVRTFTPPTGVFRLAFVDGDRYLATGDWLGGLRIWNAETGRPIAEATGHDKYILGLHVDRAKSELLTCGTDGKLNIWPIPRPDGSLAEAVPRWKRPRMIPAMDSVAARTVVNGTQSRSAVSPDFRHFAIGANDGSVRLGLTETSRATRTLTGHTDRVVFCGFSPDGKTLVTTSYDKTIRTWDVPTGKSRLILKGHGGRPSCVRFTPDGKWMISSGMQGAIKVWDASTGREAAEFPKKSAGIIRLAISPDGNYLASGGFYQTVHLWDIAKRRLVTTLEAGMSRTGALAFSPDGRLLIAGGAGGKEGANELKIWDMKTRAVRAVPRLVGSQVKAIAFAPDGRSFVTAGADKLLRLWDVETGQQLSAIPSGHPGELRSAAFSRDGTRLATSGQRGQFRQWRLKSSQRLWLPAFTTARSDSVMYQPARLVTRHPKGAWFAVYSADGRRLVTGGDDRTVRVWNTDSWKLAIPEIRLASLVLYGAFSADGKTLAVSTAKGKIHLYAADSGEKLRVLSGHDGYVRKIAFSPDGKRLVSGGNDGTARIWNVEDGKLLKTLTLGNQVWAIAVSPDGKSFATGTGNWTAKRPGGVTIWNLANGERLRSLKACTGFISSLSCISNSRIVVARGGNTGVAVWKTDTGERETVLHYPQSVRLVRVSRDGKYALAAHGQATKGMVSVWDLSSGRSISAFRVADAYLYSAEFSPSARQIVTASKDGAVRIWQRID